MVGLLLFFAGISSFRVAQAEDPRSDPVALKMELLAIEKRLDAKLEMLDDKLARLEALESTLGTSGANGFKVADIDGNGSLDIVDRSGGIYQNDGAGNFSATATHPLFGAGANVRVADVNKDGRNCHVLIRVYTQPKKRKACGKGPFDASLQ